MTLDMVRFDALWHERWGSKAEPIGWLLRGEPTWTRFHTLPDSKRYSQTEDESVEIMVRHATLVTELAGPNSESLILIVSESRSDSGQEPWVRNVFPDSLLWRAERPYTDDDVFNPPSFMVSLESKTFLDIMPALQRIADDEIESVVISDETLDWLYCPYDGGVDIIARSEVERDRLRRIYHDWLPGNVPGL